MPKRSKRGRRGATGYGLTFLAIFLLVLLGTVFFKEKGFFPAESPKPKTPPDRKARTFQARPSSPDLSKSDLPRNTPLPQMVIVLDDLGGENHLSKELLRLPLPLTLSLLPFTPYAKALAEEAHRQGKEVILHLPMEPHGYPRVNPGEGALLCGMKKREFLQQLSANLEAVPHIKGVSNHMGSRLMENPEKVKLIFTELRKRGLFFLDSRTSPHSVGLLTAKRVGLKALERTLFLDHSQKEEDIRSQIEHLIQIAGSTGTAVGIGHPYPATVRSLEEMIPRIKGMGVEVVPLSSLPPTFDCDAASWLTGGKGEFKNVDSILGG
jgi:hypothetical protein